MPIEIKTEFTVPEINRNAFLRVCEKYSYMPERRFASKTEAVYMIDGPGAEFLDEIAKLNKVKAPEGFRDVSDRCSDGRCFVHESLPIALCTKDDGTERELYFVEWDNEEEEQKRAHPAHFFFLRSMDKTSAEFQGRA